MMTQKKQIDFDLLNQPGFLSCILNVKRIVQKNYSYQWGILVETNPMRERHVNLHKLTPLMIKE